MSVANQPIGKTTHHTTVCDVELLASDSRDLLASVSEVTNLERLSLAHSYETGDGEVYDTFRYRMVLSMRHDISYLRHDGLLWAY